MAILRFGEREHTLEAFQEIFLRSDEIDDILRRKGLTEAIFTFDKYFDTSYLPLIKGEARDKMFIEKLRKIKERYFDRI